MKSLDHITKELERFLSTPHVRNKLLEAQENAGVETLGRTCGWCKKIVAEDDPVLAIKGRSKIDLSNLEGLFFPLTLLSGKILIALATTSDSDAKKEGCDFVLMACCEECGEQMRIALTDDIQMAEYIDEASKR